MENNIIYASEIYKNREKKKRIEKMKKQKELKK